MARMIDIAQRAGVSQTTVSFVLNNRSDAARISEETRGRVLDAAHELGYSTNQLARAMRTGDTRMIGFLGGLLTNEPVGAMLSGAIEEAASVGYTVKVLRVGAPGFAWHQLIGRIAEWRLSGVIALHLPKEMLEELWLDVRRGPTPLVLLDSRVEVAGMLHVLSDDQNGVARAVEHLANLGHRRIAFLTGDEQSTLTRFREEAFCAEMKKRWLDASVVIERGSFSEREKSLQAAQRLLELPGEQRPTAIVCAGDAIALATLQMAAQLKIEVPRELSVIGYANTQAAVYCTPPLSSVAQPFEQMGRAAVQQLLKLSKNPQSENLENPTSTLLPTELILRASTAPPATVAPATAPPATRLSE